MITKQDIQAAASYIFRSSFVSEDQARKAMVRVGNNATRSSSRPLEASCSRKLLKEPVEERISVLLKDRKKKVVSIFYTILIMVVCKAVIL